ncbi:MAG: OmpA family protein [Bacteroidales bacterium]
MKKTIKSVKPILYFVLGIFIMASCVPQRKYQDVVDKRDECVEENKELRQENESLTSSLKEYSAELEKYEKQIKSLKQDTAILSTTKNRLTQNYNELYTSYEQLKKNRELELSQSKEESAEILADLQKTQEDILRQRDSLRELEVQILEKEANLEEMSQELAAAQAEMEEKQKHLNELQSILEKKDSVVTALKEKVNIALRGFEGEGLSIEERNGKVYVSMEEKLLFASGSYDINPKGRNALEELGKVLEQNRDINVMVEGHTDSVPYRGRGELEDNWDLSVKRATTVIRVLTEKSGIDNSRLIAAGRSEYLPIATNESKEGRAKNRRTEIILTPKLDELFDIIENN